MKPPPNSAQQTRFRRSLRMSGGFLLLLAGIPLLVLPGPGAPAIFLGLNLLAVDFPWAQRLLARLRAAIDQLQRRFFSRSLSLGRARHMASGLSRRMARRRLKAGKRAASAEVFAPKDGLENAVPPENSSIP